MKKLSKKVETIIADGKKFQTTLKRRGFVDQANRVGAILEEVWQGETKKLLEAPKAKGTPQLDPNGNPVLDAEGKPVMVFADGATPAGPDGSGAAEGGGPVTAAGANAAAAGTGN